MSEMPRCKTCKHFKPEEYIVCTAPLMHDELDKPPEEVKQRGVVMNSEVGTWLMIPGPDFGCTLHEAGE